MAGFFFKYLIQFLRRWLIETIDKSSSLDCFGRVHSLYVRLVRIHQHSDVICGEK